MSDFKAKMHENRFQLEFRPRLRWRNLQRFPDPLAGFKRPTSKGKDRGRGDYLTSQKNRSHAPVKTWTGLSVEEWTDINGESTSMVWPTLKSRTAKT